YRNRSIIDAHFSTHDRVVFLQEVFIEVNSQVLFVVNCKLSGLMSHQRTNITNSKHFTKFINDISQTSIKIRTSNVVKELAQERISPWNGLNRFTTIKIIQRIIVIASSKQAIYKRLGV